MYKILKAEKLSENIFLMDVHAQGLQVIVNRGSL